MRILYISNIIITMNSDSIYKSLSENGVVKKYIDSIWR